jgi:spermidine synthase
MPDPSAASAARDEVRDAEPYIREDLASRSLYFSLEDVQSRMRLREPDVLDLRYTRTMMGFLLLHPQPRSILMVGLGGGSLAKFCRRHLPAARIEVVEVNARVIGFREAFRVPKDDERFRVVEAEASEYMARASRRHDVILLDAFGARGLPKQLSTQRFYDDCLDTLEPGGVLVVNLHTAAPDCALCIERLERTFGGEALPVPDEEGVNTIVFARKGERLIGTAPSTTRPKHLDTVGWSQVNGAFGRIAAALASRRQDAARAED